MLALLGVLPLLLGAGNGQTLDEGAPVQASPDTGAAFAAASDPASPGLSTSALQELEDSGLFRYVGAFQPAASRDLGGGWTRHRFDARGGDGPVCITGSDYSVYTRAGSPTDLLVFQQGGGACWQDFYFCNLTAQSQAAPPPPAGIWDLDAADNPFGDSSILYLPYCDGSFFSGDAAVPDPGFGHGGVRHHRGLRNQTAALDLAARLFPEAQRITLAGSSAGGVGVATFAPLLARRLFGNEVDLTVVNDAGPVAQNPEQSTALAARARDWAFGRFLPASCTACDDRGDPTALIDWRLDHDATVRDAFYSTDADVVVRFFLGVASQEEYRELLLGAHEALHEAHPLRYKRFIPSGDISHAVLLEDRFYTQTADDVPFSLWLDFFLTVPDLTPDLVEDLEPVP